MGVDDEAANGEYVQWISFCIPEGQYVVLLSDVGHRDGTPVQIADGHILAFSAIYKVPRTFKGLEDLDSAIRIQDDKSIVRILDLGMLYETPLQRFFLMICDWIRQRIL